MYFNDQNYKKSKKNHSKPQNLKSEAKLNIDDEMIKILKNRKSADNLKQESSSSISLGFYKKSQSGEKDTENKFLKPHLISFQDKIGNENNIILESMQTQISQKNSKKSKLTSKVSKNSSDEIKKHNKQLTIQIDVSSEKFSTIQSKVLQNPGRKSAQKQQTKEHDPKGSFLFKFLQKESSTIGERRSNNRRHIRYNSSSDNLEVKESSLVADDKNCSNLSLVVGQKNTICPTPLNDAHKIDTNSVSGTPGQVDLKKRPNLVHKQVKMNILSRPNNFSQMSQSSQQLFSDFIKKENLFTLENETSPKKLPKKLHNSLISLQNEQSTSQVSELVNQDIYLNRSNQSGLAEKL